MLRPVPLTGHRPITSHWAGKARPYLFALTAVIALSGQVWAESWPELSDLVPKCPLILRVKIEHQPSAKGQAYAYADVVEVWSGEYRRDAFAVEPPASKIIIPNGSIPEKGAPPLELIAFYDSSSLTADRLLAGPSMTLRVTPEGVTYPPRAELTSTYPLAKFKEHIKAIASDIPADKDPRKLVGKRDDSKPRPASITDLTGEWRVFLPAGFEHAMTITRVTDGRYELGPSSLNFAGRYEFDGNFLVRDESDVGKSERSPGDYRWRVVSRHMITLVEQTANTGSDYTGATLFRPREK